MTFGLTATGFERKRLADIEAEVITAIEAAYGPINQNDDSLIRQLIGIMSERFATIWELAEAVYFAVYPSSAEGVQLDNVAELSGITRIAAAKSTAVIAALGTGATVIPLGNQFSSATTGDVFESDAAVTIQQTDVVRIQIEVTTADNTQTFTITIDGTPYAFVSDASATKQEIVTGLIAALVSGSAPMAGVDDGTGDSLTLTANDGETGYNVTVAATGVGVLTVLTIETPVAVTALNTGVALVNAGQIDTIVSPVAGLTAVENLADGVQGRAVETDAALRVRINSVRFGAATVEAIKSRLADEVDGVSVVIVVENRTDSVVAGQPAHSIQVIVQGGADADVAAKIWELKGAGIETYGSSSEVVVDSAGQNQTVYFSRPTTVYGWVKVRYTGYDEESLPAGADAAIADAIKAYGDTFTIGLDMLWQRFLTPVLTTVEGVASSTIELDHTATAGGPPSYSLDTDVPVDLDEWVVFDLTRIDVAEAP
jgi:uncharacterized phage protein gp47/JayE